MKFVIFREIIVKDEKKRRFLLEWPADKIAAELEKELSGAGAAFNKVVEKFKKESIRIP